MEQHGQGGGAFVGRKAAREGLLQDLEYRGRKDEGHGAPIHVVGAVVGEEVLEVALVVELVREGQREGQDLVAQHPLLFEIVGRARQFTRGDVWPKDAEVVVAEDQGDGVAALERTRKRVAEAVVKDLGAFLFSDHAAEDVDLREVEVAHAGEVREAVHVLLPDAE